MSDRHSCLGAHAVEEAEKACGCCTSSTGTSWVPPIRSTSAPSGAGPSAPPPLSVMGETTRCELGRVSYVTDREAPRLTRDKTASGAAVSAVPGSVWRANSQESLTFDQA